MEVRNINPLEIVIRTFEIPHPSAQGSPSMAEWIASPTFHQDVPGKHSRPRDLTGVAVAAATVFVNPKQTTITKAIVSILFKLYFLDETI